LRFTAVDLSSPNNIRIQYRLDGVDPEWLDADSTRTAIYTKVPAGTHSFHIRATNGEGVWDREGIAYDITQQPYFYETAVFRLGFLVALGFAVLLFFRFRVHQITRRIHLLFEERLAERTRIARDFHDTLLQSFQAALLNFNAVQYTLDDHPEAQKRLEKVIDQARQAVSEGRDAVQGLRSSTVVNNELAESFRALGDELIAGQGGGPVPELRVYGEGSGRKLAPIIREEVYRIGCEAVRNAWRHAQASQVEVWMQYDTRHFRLRISDNGKGIPPHVLAEGRRTGHHGLPGMQERARLVRGKLTVSSKPESGTQVELVVPASVAYLSSHFFRRLMAQDKKEGQAID
jgi:signal transduction histidine kinase